MNKIVILNNKRACNCVAAVGSLHMIHMQVLRDGRHLTWEMDKTEGDDYQVLVTCAPLVTCITCGTPWTLSVEIEEQPAWRVAAPNQD
jgi:hypothetical protein